MFLIIKVEKFIVFLYNYFMYKEKKGKVKKLYKLATRDINSEALIVAGAFAILMIVGACVIDDKRFVFVPLLFAVICFIALLVLLFRFFTEPKTAIQADCDGVYFYYRKNREVFIPFDDIVEVSWLGVRNRYGSVVVTSKTNTHKSIRIREDTYDLTSQIRYLLQITNREEYLKIIEIKRK